LVHNVEEKMLEAILKKWDDWASKKPNTQT